MTVDLTDILGARILIVDDLAANVQLLERMLHESGYRCLTSTMDPRTVCALHATHHYDLILLDLQMPGMDGFAVMDELKKIETEGYVPILVITAQPGHKLRALTSGAKDFISKPFDLMEFRMRVYNMLEVRLLYKKLKNSNRMLESLALHDPLTGLPNRRLLMDRLALAIAHAKRHNRTMALMFLDLDGFKQVNDTLGHDVGDTLLQMAAKRLVGAVRQGDTVARLGGDEFVVALPDLKHGDDVVELVAKVVQAMAQPYRIQGHGVNVTASVGVSVYPAHGEDVQTLMKSADLALYEAKNSGKNDCRISGHAEL
ncbi:diguanylate cyclase [Rhodoferax sp.]|uniref:GGDEF domain-containing response regulator n=1 Tax=Rhodoferax sp. TaxID=50421 RepID=UPI0025DC561C|nr:diguanylate cyclase [Rhodoferax sp.]